MLHVTRDLQDCVHFEMIVVNDGGVFADNLPLIQMLIQQEMEGCMTVVFLNVGTSYLIVGGQPTDLLKINKQYRDYIMGFDIIIDYISHSMSHEVFFMPLIFNRYTQLRINDVHLFTSTKAQPRTINQIPNHTYNKFIEYNLLAKQENHKHYPSNA